MHARKEEQKTKSHHAFSKTMTEHVSEVGANGDFVCGVTFLTLRNHLLVRKVSMKASLHCVITGNTTLAGGAV